MAESTPAIENLFSEARTFPPPDDFKAKALVSDRSLHEQAERDLEGFWAEEAGRLRWTRRWDRVLEWELPFAKWFVGGQLNVSDNCLDRHVEAGGGDKVAYHWVGEPGDDRTITYAELRDEVARFANALKSLGVKKGDRVNIYMGMVPELPVAMLACARLGAPHSVVFGGFSADALRDRINDAEAKVLITQDEGWRAGKVVPLKSNADEAVAGAPTIEKVVVLRRAGNGVPWSDGRDVWWHELVYDLPADCPPEPMDAEDLLYLLYTSGTTARPKGIMHTTGVLYEGAPNFPEKDRWWEIVERYKVTILYTAPTAIRTFMKWGEDWPAKHDLSSLRLLGTVGEPINPEAWVWYQTNIGGGRCPGGGHLVADGDGDDPDHAAARGDRHQAGLGDVPVPGRRRRHRRQRRATGRDPRRWLPGPQEALAGDAARHLRRPGAVPGDLLEPLRRALLRGRRGQAGRGRLLLAARTGRRRDERLGPPDLDHRGRVGPGRPPGRRGGGGDRQSGRADGAADRRLRHPQGRRGAGRGHYRGAP